MARSVTKRSVRIAERKTSISVEDNFWQSLKDIAEERNCSVDELITQIKEISDQRNLSSAIRVFVLKHFREKAANR